MRVVDRDGKTRDYASAGADPAKIPAGERRVMDCVDCHNRVGHPFAMGAARAVDEALASGLLPSLPFMRREAVAALNASAKAPGGTTAAQRAQAFYAGGYPTLASDPRLPRATAGLDALERRYVFPTMKVGFGTYPDRSGHADDKGCFRCHDEEHKTADGRAIPQDCESCHRQ